MARRATGVVIERRGKQGVTYAARFTAYGEREYETLGHSWEGYTKQQADDALAAIMADVRRGIWKPWADARPPAPPEDPTFHKFASEWLTRLRGGLATRTVEDYEWALCNHLLPFFHKHRLSEITVAEVDRYKAAKLREREQQLVKRPLSNSSINKTIRRLSQILDFAVVRTHTDAEQPGSRASASTQSRTPTASTSSSRPSRGPAKVPGDTAGAARDRHLCRRSTGLRANRSTLASHQPRRASDDRAGLRRRTLRRGASLIFCPISGIFLPTTSTRHRSTVPTTTCSRRGRAPGATATPSERAFCTRRSSVRTCCLKLLAKRRYLPT